MIALTLIFGYYPRKEVIDKEFCKYSSNNKYATRPINPYAILVIFELAAAVAVGTVIIVAFFTDENENENKKETTNSYSGTNVLGDALSNVGDFLSS